MPRRRKGDHIGNFNFKIEIEGVTQGAFKNVEGFDSETEIISVGDPNGVSVDQKRPGRSKFGNLVLKRGYINSPELWNWRKRVIEGHIERKAGAVVLCGDDGTEIMRYNFFEAWPTKWKGFVLDGKGTDVTVEELELAIELVDLG